MMGKLNPGGAKGEEYTQAHSPRHAWLLRPVFLAWISKKLLLLLKRSSEPAARRRGPRRQGKAKQKLPVMSTRTSRSQEAERCILHA